MPLIQSNAPKDIETPNGSLKFTSNGIVLSTPTGNSVTIGTTAIEMSCGGVLVRMTQGDIVISCASTTIKLTPAECSVVAVGNLRMTAPMVNVNNGALEVM